MAGSGGSGDGANISSSLKWQVALAVGIPVAVGAGYWYYRSYKTEGNDNNYDLSPKPQEKAHLGVDQPPISSTECAKDMTPLERALALKDEGNTFFKKGMYEEALQCYQAAIDVGNEVDNTNLATFYQNKAAAHEQLKQYEEVIKDCSMALLLQPKYIKALLRRAKAYEMLKDLPKALVDVSAVCILESFRNFTTMSMTDRILRDLGDKHAKEEFAHKKPSMPSPHFIKMYFTVFSKDPLADFEVGNGDTSKGFLKAIYSLQNENYSAIIDACSEEIMENGVYKNEALLLRGTMFILTGQPLLAMEDLGNVIDEKFAPVDLKVNALVKRSTLHMQLVQPEKSFNDFETAISLDPNNPDIYHQRAQIYLLDERTKDAQNDMIKAISLVPERHTIKVQKHFTDYRLGLAENDEAQVMKAIIDFEEYIRDYPKCPEGYTLYAQIASERLLYDKAEELFKKAIELDPLNATLMVQRAILNFQWKSNINEAMELVKAAIKVDDRCGFAYETLGTMLVQNGDLKEAIQAFDKALEQARNQLECAHIYSLKDATIAQETVFREMNLKMPNVAM